jgi:hypothetical protein
MGDRGLARWLGVAAAIHVAGAGLTGLMSAGSVDAKLRYGAPIEAMIESIDVAVEPVAAAARPPEPKPAMPSRLADAPGTSSHNVTGPPVPKPIAPTSPDVPDKIAAHFADALSAVAAQAAKILASTDGDGPPMVNGNADSAYGMVAGDGRGTLPTFSSHAGLHGRPGGTGAPAPEAPDRSRGASVNRGYDTECPFPVEADRAHIDHGWADLIVRVGADGRASRVHLLDDSGYGFGRVAQQCAMRVRYRTALNRNGSPIEQDTPSFRYGFHR